MSHKGSYLVLRKPSAFHILFIEGPEAVVKAVTEGSYLIAVDRLAEHKVEVYHLKCVIGVLGCTVAQVGKALDYAFAFLGGMCFGIGYKTVDKSEDSGIFYNDRIIVGLLLFGKGSFGLVLFTVLLCSVDYT